MNDFYFGLETTYENGTIIYRNVYSFGSNVNLIKEGENGYYLRSRTNYENSIITDRELYTYGSNGNLIKAVGEEYYNNGVIEDIDTVTYTYDADGNLIKEVDEDDYDGDGIVDDVTINTYTYDYDADGNLIREVDDYDYDGDGIVDDVTINTYTYDYDADGNLIREVDKDDYDGDGIVDDVNTVTYTYDSNGNLIERVNEYDGNIQTYTYDSNGNQTSYTFDEDSSDGIVESGSTNIYDAEGRLFSVTNISLYDDFNGDGQINEDDEQISTSSYTYDANDNLIKTIYRSYGNDFFTNITTFTYDLNNNLTSSKSGSDNNGDGELAENEARDKFDYTYDADDNLIEATYLLDTPYSDDYDRLYTFSYTYDLYGNLIEETYDDDSDGTIESKTVYDYATSTELGIELNEEPSLSLSEVHRFYQREKGFHFYSSDTNEINIVRNRSDAGELAYDYEQEKYQVLNDNKDALTGETIKGVEEVYRFFNRDTGAHLYTMNENEKDTIQATLPNYDYEGITHYAFEIEPNNVDTIPVYRMLNNNTGTHLFSIDDNEIANIQNNLPHFSMENNGNAVFYVMEL